MSIFNYVRVITVQNNTHHSACAILHVSKTIYNVSDNFIISPFADSLLNNSLQELLSSLRHLRTDDVLHVPPTRCTQGV
jgi:hypothetical protein